MKSSSYAMASSINFSASLESVIPKAILSSITTSSISPLIYLMILSFEVSQVFLASGLKASMAGLITGRNFLSTFLPEYSVTELILVKYFRDSLPTKIIQSYNEVSMSISQSRFSTFLIAGFEHS